MSPDRDPPTVAPDPVAAAATVRPDAEAVVDAGVRWTWAELDRQVGEIARRLSASGAGPGPAGRVAILAGESASAVAAIHAVRRLGATLVMVNRRAAAPEIETLLGVVRPALLLHDDVTADLVRSALEPGRVDPGVVDISRPPRSGEPPPDEPARAVMADPAAPATLVFTSGTTGRPKAAILTHANHAASAAAWAAFLEPVPTDRWLACLPFHHVAGLGMIDRAARWGVPLVVQPGFDPAAVADAIERDGISHLSLVGSTLGRLVEVLAGRAVPGSLRAVLVGGERTRPEALGAAGAAGLPIVTTYGLTETASGIVAQMPADVLTHPGAAGLPLPGVDLRIRDEGRSVGAGVVGDVEVRGGMVFAGYLGEPDATAAVLDDGWLRTGDLGAVDAAGRLTIADRREDLVISGGENVYPVEVEAVLRDHPAILDAAVVGRPDPTWGSVPLAAIVVRLGVDPSDAELQAHCRASLAGYKVPAAFVRVVAIPRSPTGKVLRLALREGLLG